MGLTALILAAATLTAIKPQAAPETTRSSVWSVGVAGGRHSLKAGDGNEILGNYGSVQLGTGYISRSWYTLVAIDFLLGPYEPTRNRQLDVDYTGTGITAWVGFSAQTLDLRSQEGGYGFALGLSYADSVGRSVGRNRQEGTAPAGTTSAKLIDDYALRVTNFSLLPAIFFCWLQEGRPPGNTPELLATRIEGFVLTIGAAMPLMVSYSAKYTTRARTVSDSNTPADTKDDVTEPGKTVREPGRMRGYSILASVTALLGT